MPLNKGILIDIYAIFNFYRTPMTYYYNKQGPDRILKLYGSLNGLEMELFESDENGNQTGHFKGNFKSHNKQSEYKHKANKGIL